MEIKLKENERIDDLEFKNLKIIQNKDGFCFGIDSVLLSNYAKDIKRGTVGLDLGTGTGILGILLCGKTDLSKIHLFVVLSLNLYILNHQFSHYYLNAFYSRPTFNPYVLYIIINFIYFFNKIKHNIFIYI